MLPSASKISPSASKRLNLKLLEPALQTRIFIFASNIGSLCQHPLGLHADMPIVVPQPDDGLGQVVFVTQCTQARGGQHEVFPEGGLEAEPAPCEYPQKMCAGEKQHVTCDGAHALYDPVCPRVNLVRRFPSGAAIAKELPIRVFLV